VRLDTPVKFLKGIGERRAEAFARLGVYTAQDLLWHLPHRYIDASTVTPLAGARVGDDVACVGRVVDKGVVPTRRGLRIFRAVLRDDSGVLECAWPGQPFLDRSIAAGQTLLVAGPIRFYHGRQMVPREHLVLADAGEEAGAAAGRVLPVYPATENLSHKVIRALVDRHLESLIGLVQDIMPADLRERLGLPLLPDALRAVHRPRAIAEAEFGRRRLAFDELFDLQLMLVRARTLAKRQRSGITFELRRDLTTRLRETLPYQLTNDQKQAVREITSDMTAPERMHRLLMGDVGTGKTVVALFAMLLAVENGFQAALMAPTELLAEQHGRTLHQLLEPLEIEPELLLGRMTAAEKAASRTRLASGGARVAVGTHALLQESVRFHRLGLVVIDEQHRFGVEQRAALIGKGAVPDVLLLSATPIPRSLALTLYGDLDVSQIRERPPGRGEVRTALRGERHRERVLDFMAAQCRSGRQAYVVLPVIEESEKADLRAATTMAEVLTARWPDLRVALVHGGEPRSGPHHAPVPRRRGPGPRGDHRHRGRNRRAECDGHAGGASGALRSAQLHQLRGRIDAAPARATASCSRRTVPERLTAFAATTDGFEIAELDLKERGMGDLIGARQSGGVEVRHARLPDDTDLLARARELAAEVLAGDPLLQRTGNRPLRQRALARYPRATELFRVG
jgi:ATP-dependent DNA helicase RecG